MPGEAGRSGGRRDTPQREMDSPSVGACVASARDERQASPDEPAHQGRDSDAVATRYLAQRSDIIDAQSGR